MSRENYKPTDEQTTIIRHDGNAFISACPGAGKTRVLVERARHIFKKPHDTRGVSFLSFTNAAICELEQRLHREGIPEATRFPNFVGTFDKFLWQFCIAPFGIPGAQVRPRLIPDKGDWAIKPFPNAQALPLKCFNRADGKIIAATALLNRFDTTKRPATKHERSAFDYILRTMAAGQIDFEDVRAIVRVRLSDAAFAERLGEALAGRFLEVVVDEAQDCNPEDLNVIKWLRSAGVTVKVICDPHQSIYGFRGGIAHELYTFRDTFKPEERLTMTGNFRSSPAICDTISLFRPQADRGPRITSSGQFSGDTTPVHIASYRGTSAPASIGTKFAELLAAEGLTVDKCPILASARSSAKSAIGMRYTESAHATLRLATIVTSFYSSPSTTDSKTCLNDLHQLLLEIRGELSTASYREYLDVKGLTDGSWRPEVIGVLRALQFDPAQRTPEEWLASAKALLAPTLPAGRPTISQLLKSSSDLADHLTAGPKSSCPARTIHSVKGAEFPAVCVVLVPRTAGKILDYIESGAIANDAENVRKLYVAASRAERLLLLAVPHSQAHRLATLLRRQGVTPTVTAL